MPTWEFTRKTSCGDHEPTWVWSHVSHAHICCVCDRVRPTARETIRITGANDLSHYTASQVAMVRLQCEPFQLAWVMTDGPADVEARWEGSDAGSPPTKHLVVIDLASKTKPAKKLARRKSK